MTPETHLCTSPNRCKRHLKTGTKKPSAAQQKRIFLSGKVDVLRLWRTYLRSISQETTFQHTICSEQPRNLTKHHIKATSQTGVPCATIKAHSAWLVVPCTPPCVHHTSTPSSVTACSDGFRPRDPERCGRAGPLRRSGICLQKLPDPSVGALASEATYPCK